MTGVSASAHAMEAGVAGKSCRSRAEAAQSAVWAIQQGPGRGYITLDSDLFLIADALAVLWFLRAQRAGDGHASPR